VKTLKVLYMNADSLINKHVKLETFLNDRLYKPDIIGIVEVKANNCTVFPQISEFALDSYDVCYVNLDNVYGRGVLLYTALWINVSPYIPDGPALDSVWITTKLLERDRLIIGCIYRSLSSSAMMIFI